MKFFYATDASGPVAYPIDGTPPKGSTPIRQNFDPDVEAMCVVCGGRSSNLRICRNCKARGRRRYKNPYSCKRAPTGYWEPTAMTHKNEWVDDFNSRIDKSSDCFEWTGTKVKSGYGVFAFGGRSYLAHRLSFLLNGGAHGFPVIMHTCDNPRCVNPAHLVGGSYKENTDDMIAKGRQVVVPSPHLADRNNHPRSKPIVTPDGEFKSSSLAADFYGNARAAMSYRSRSHRFPEYKYAQR